MMKTVKIIKIAYGVITAIAVTALVVLAAEALLLGISGIDRENPKSVLGYRSFIVLTGSMNPEFDAGSLIIIRETARDVLKVGDIVTYRPLKSDDTLLTHRIVRVEGERYITRGDANNTDDPNPVAYEAILGKVVLHINGAGEFIVNLRTPTGLVAMIGAIAVILFIIPAAINWVYDRARRKAGVTEEDEPE